MTSPMVDRFWLSKRTAASASGARAVGHSAGEIHRVAAVCGHERAYRSRLYVYLHFLSLQTGKGVEAMKKNDKGFRELLNLLKIHPELLTVLVFDPESVERVLRSTGARRLVLSVDLRAFLRRIVRPAGGAPAALCLRRTGVFCPRTKR